MPLDPQIQTVIREAIESRLLDLHVGMPGTVLAWDPVKREASIKLSTQRQVSSERFFPESLPDLHGVPVLFPRGGGMSIAFPMATGDPVFVLFSETSFAQWYLSGLSSPPGDLRKHGLSYPVAIPGMLNLPTHPGVAPLDRLQIISELIGGQIDVFLFPQPDGSTVHAGGSADFVALASLVKAALDAIIAQHNTHVHNETGTVTGAPTVLMSATTIVKAANLKTT